VVAGDNQLGASATEVGHQPLPPHGMPLGHAGEAELCLALGRDEADRHPDGL